jgi:energy-coupling factor transporter ATP-binding protein EcfA2
MRLISLELHEFRRFPDAKVKLEGKLICIVGPNEAGKTSILEALRYLNDDRRLTALDVRRGVHLNADDPVLTARFEIDDADRKALADVPNAADVKWFTVGRRADGELFTGVEPPPVRNRSARSTAAEALRRARDLDWMKAEGAETQIPALAESVQSLFEQDAEDFTEAQLVPLQQLAGLVAALGESEAPEGVRGLDGVLQAARDSETQEPPEDRAREILAGRRPEFLLFEQLDRDLDGEYELAQAAGSPSPALQHLTRLAGLNLSDVLAAIQRGDFPQVEELQEAANKRLRVEFKNAWKQSKIAVRFRLEQVMLRLLVDTDEGFSSLVERSEGVRTFAALLAYTSEHRRSVKPVLLIDEAETHLHYDAQADLVRVLTRQDTVAQVVYTTHSAGCLPEDLGTGIRVVRPGGDGSSQVANSFWQAGPGMAPLILGMGASLLAFTPARYAAMAEGGSDAALLPTLLRQAVGVDSLGYQIVPGAAEVSEAAVQRLEHEAARVGYVVDGDAEGREIAGKLRRGGADAARILQLPDPLMLEDLVEPAAYLEALNLELKRSHDESTQMNPAELKSPGHVESVGAWCATRGLDPPAKIAVAMALVEMGRRRPIVGAQHQPVLDQIHRDLMKIFDPK